MEENRNITPKEYTDKDMWVVARLAYINFTNEMTGTIKNPLSLSQILSNKQFYDEIYNDLIGEVSDIEPGSLEEAKYEEKREFLELLKNDPVYSNWKLVDVVNYNEKEGDGNGFCAITIQTDADNAIVGFRGSEGLENIFGELFREDWIMADVGLLDSIITTQQASATEYMKTVQKLGYSNYVTCGHSLGGNLATHALLTAPDMEWM